MELKDKKILVTGAGGFIASHLIERLILEGCKLRAFVHYNSRNKWGWIDLLSKEKSEKIEIFAGDIRDHNIVRKAVKGVDIIFHLAALIGIPYSYFSPDSYVETNVRGTLNLLQAADEGKIRCFIHTSTSEVYGTAQYVPINENHPINPQSPYAATKSAADLLAMSFYRSFNLPVSVVRPFNTYGPRQSARAIIPTIITQILKGSRTINLGSLHPTRDFTFVKDTVEGFIKAAVSKNSIGEIINLGSSYEISMGELADKIAKLMCVSIKVKSEEARKRPKNSEVERLYADNTKAKEFLGWMPRYSLEKGLIETIKWLKTNKDNYKPGIYNI